MRLLPLLAAGALLAAVPTRASAQEAHAGAQGYVYETEVDRVRDGVLTLANGAAVATTPELAPARGGRAAILVLLRSGCRIWIETVGLSPCTLARELPGDARGSEAALVWVERVLDAGATVVLTGGSVFQVRQDQTELTNSWRPGEAILIGDARLLHLDHSAEVVDVVRLR